MKNDIKCELQEFKHNGFVIQKKGGGLTFWGIFHYSIIWDYIKVFGVLIGISISLTYILSLLTTN